MKYNPEKQLSIIVCCYSGEKTLPDCLESLRNLNTGSIELEVILIDDGSKDGTSDIIKKFMRKNTELKSPKFYYYRKRNEGLSIARNYGIRKSNNSIIAFIDEDAIADTNFAVNVLKSFNLNPSINCISGKVELLNRDSKFANLVHTNIFSVMTASDNAVIGTNMAFRKSIVYDVGGFQPEFTYRGDETAFMAKGGNRITTLKVSDVIVWHAHPATLWSWLKTRYENGYFGAAIKKLMNNNFLNSKNRILLNCLTISMLLTAIPLFLVFKLAGLFVLSSSMLILIIRFFIKNSILTAANHYYKHNSDNHLIIYIYLIYIEFCGVVCEEIGFMIGYKKYRNYFFKTVHKEGDKALSL